MLLEPIGNIPPTEAEERYYAMLDEPAIAAWLKPNGLRRTRGGSNRFDHGSEFVSRDLDLWAYAKGVTLDFSRPGKPTDNAFIEAFNGRSRSDCLNTHWFLTLADAEEKMEA